MTDTFVVDWQKLATQQEDVSSVRNWAKYETNRILRAELQIKIGDIRNAL